MATIGNTASGPITDPVADRYLAVADLADAIAERLRAEVARLGFSAAEVSLMAPADAHYHLDRDPASGTHSLVGDWIDARGARLGILLFHADGSFYVEHDVLRQHPIEARWFVEAVTAWGRDADIRSEARLLPIPQ